MIALPFFHKANQSYILTPERVLLLENLGFPFTRIIGLYSLQTLSSGIPVAYKVYKQFHSPQGE